MLTLQSSLTHLNCFSVTHKDSVSGHVAKNVCDPNNVYTTPDHLPWPGGGRAPRPQLSRPSSLPRSPRQTGIDRELKGFQEANKELRTYEKLGFLVRPASSTEQECEGLFFVVRSRCVSMSNVCPIHMYYCPHFMSLVLKKYLIDFIHIIFYIILLYILYYYIYKAKPKTSKFSIT